MKRNLETPQLAMMGKLSSSNDLVTPHDRRPVVASGPSFQAFEIEEFVDVYFFRPLGFILARCADTLRVTPIQLTIFGTFLGVVGGVALFDAERFGLIGFGLLIVHNIFDSADGQLARLTARVTELGRVLDGVGDYITHAAIYISITAGLLHRGGSSTIIVWAALAATANIIQAQMYEYHRHHYAMIVVKRLVPRDEPAKIQSPLIGWLYRNYLIAQRMLNTSHVDVEFAIAARSTAGVVQEEDRARYREYFLRPMRGWNLLGVTKRYFAIGVLVCLHRIDLYFAFVLIPMNLALLVLWNRQQKADRKFLASI